MKNIIKTLLIFTLACTGCSIDSILPNPSGGTMSCTLDGQNWTASEEVSGVNVLSFVSISGADKSKTTILLSMDSGDVKTGATIDLGSLNGNSFANQLTSLTITKNGKEYVLPASDGAVTITAASKSAISGTFNFTASDPNGQTKDVKVTNGKFSAKILF